MAQKIKIISGEVRSGKTGRLKKWLAGHPGADGIISPVIEGKRYLQRISSGEKRLLDARGGEDQAAVEGVGRHLFLKETFAWARQQLLDSARQTHWLVVDEIGPLELQGKGLEPALSAVLQENPVSLIVVVRSRLVEQVKERYGWEVVYF